MHCPLSAQDLTSVGNRHILTAIDFVCDMSTFKKLLGFGAEEDKSQSSSRQPTSAVSGEHSGSLSSAAQKASNLVPATIAERDDANDQTVCQKESQVQDITTLICSFRSLLFVLFTCCQLCRLGSVHPNARLSDLLSQHCDLPLPVCLLYFGASVNLRLVSDT